MKIALISRMVLGAAVGLSAYATGQDSLAPSAQEEQPAQERADADNLYDLVKQARADLRELGAAAGLAAYSAGSAAGPRESQERERAGEHGGRQGGGEGDERGGGEHGGSGREGEEGGAYLPKMTKQNKLFANGARLVLEFDPRTQVFVGSVTNATARTLPQVRVEVHLDNGTELGPTNRIDVAPGQTVPVELGAFGNAFSSWVSHPEAGVERGHGVSGEEGREGVGEYGGGEGRGGEVGEHGSGEGARPRGTAYRPVYNQFQILRGEIRAFERDVSARSR